MKKIFVLSSLILALTISSKAQALSGAPDGRVSDATSFMFAPPQSGNFISNFINNTFDDQHFQMNHSYSLEYNSGLNNTVGEYVNTMVYKFNAPVWLRADIGLQHQPFGASKQQQQMGFNSSAFSGVYLKNASILYKPTENMGIMLQFSQIPASQMYLNNWNNRFGGGFMNSSFRATTGGTTDPFGW